MKKKTISSIDVVPSRRLFLGDIISERKIALIEDKSIELNSGAIESLYLCKDEEGNVLVSIEKCPVVVYYEYIEVDDDMTDRVMKMAGEIKKHLGDTVDEMHHQYNDDK